MEHDMGRVRSKVLGTRSLVMVIALVAAVTLSNLWLNRGSPPLGYSRYTGFGFTVEYSQRMTMREADLGGYGPPTDSGGMVQWTRQDKELEQFGVFWIKPEGLSSSVSNNPAGALAQIFGYAELTGTKIGVRGELKTMIKDGREVFYQRFTVEEPGINIPGVVGAWYSEASGKYLILFTIHVPDIYHPEIVSQEVETLWLEHLVACTDVKASSGEGG